VGFLKLNFKKGAIMSPLSGRIARITAGTLLLLVALNAFAGGYYGMSGAPGIPVEWLEGSAFSDYFVPSLFLFIVVGGASLFAALAVFKNYGFSRSVALFTAFLILSWIIVQVSIIGYVSWMQPATAIAGSFILFLSLQLPRREVFKNTL
jgi:hypothetical protein